MFHFVTNFRPSNTGEEGGSLQRGLVLCEMIEVRAVQPRKSQSDFFGSWRRFPIETYSQEVCKRKMPIKGELRGIVKVD